MWQSITLKMMMKATLANNSSTCWSTWDGVDREMVFLFPFFGVPGHKWQLSSEAAEHHTRTRHHPRPWTLGWGSSIGNGKWTSKSSLQCIEWRVANSGRPVWVWDCTDSCGYQNASSEVQVSVLFLYQVTRNFWPASGGASERAAAMDSFGVLCKKRMILVLCSVSLSRK